MSRLRFSWRRDTALPLRLRMMLTFAVTSVVVSGILSVATLLICSSYMKGQRERSATRQAVVYAQLVDSTADKNPSGLVALLAGLNADVRCAVITISNGQKQTSSNFPDLTVLPSAIVTAIDNHKIGLSHITPKKVDGLLVAVPMSDPDRYFLAVFSMREVNRNLRFLTWILAAGVLVSAVGGVVLGRWATSRSLRPLVDLTTAAALVAAGDLSVRLRATRDPDLRPLVAAFNETAARLQDRVRHDARFASDVSHELRSPLTTMLSAMSVLKRRRGEMSPPAQEAIDLLHEDLHRFHVMVNDLLDLSVIREDHEQLAFERVDLAVLVGHVLKAHDRTSLAVLELPRTPTYVLADRRRLERVLVNLLHNARHHGGGVVRVAVRDHAGSARVEIDDAGPGIPLGHRERIFDRFARAPSSGDLRSYEGAGLGLALVSEHMSRHGGRTWVTERPGGGARFVIELPADRNDATP